ncbi:MAG: hypothetical protein QJT81_12425 [Candidatus Thiothrix putei]|uniref:Uncharacterized protein n=1 Tax=Candidatus Thiothrix putei TaxID=3080811 RepID=A0AA95KGN7_9GAMM|nr:MAG: hypothetical protein QJT81_12425 [Candidatus Thiothrix putei]
MSNPNQTYNYRQLQKELFAALYLAATIDNLLQDTSVLPNKAELSHQVSANLEKIYELLNAIKTNRAFREDNSPNTNLYETFRG